MRSPILFIAFNRPDVTQKTFDVIKKVRPTKLYIAADGPRQNKIGEEDLCRAVKEIVTNVDWPCQLHTLFHEKNLGCKEAVSGAINWFFEQESEGIILEDDCLPDPSFFRFCDELLERFRADERVGMISGCNFQNGIKCSKDSYYFSHFCHIWGWATWARSWKNYDSSMTNWPNLKQSNWLTKLGFKGNEKRHWEKAFDGVFNKTIDTWDHQWTFTLWINNQLAVMPSENLISNIGFRDDATHTKGRSIFSKMIINEISFPLLHPKDVVRDVVADNYSSRTLFTNSYILRGLRKIKAYLKVS